jgi:hypothetical protein
MGLIEKVGRYSRKGSLIQMDAGEFTSRASESITDNLLLDILEELGEIKSVLIAIEGATPPEDR